MAGKSSGDSCIVGPVEPPTHSDELRLVNSQGPLSRDEATRLLDRGAQLLESGDFSSAFQFYRRVIGFDDPAITAAALLGAGQARYRFDDEAGAVATWESILELPETPSTYPAWREIAAARVRDGDLQGAIAAYREAERRAPPEDKAEIATRLGWLAKETGNVRASRRYFARGRGATLPIVTYAIIGITVVDLADRELISSEGEAIVDALALYKPAVARRRALAAVDGDARPRRHPPPRLQHVRALDRRPARRADLRPGQDAARLSRGGARRVRRRRSR